MLLGQSGQTFFTGARNFQAAEVEVYQVVQSDDLCSISVNVPLENFDRVLECRPDVHTPLLRTLNRDENFCGAQGGFFWSLAAGIQPENDLQKPEWPSADADKMIEHPPLLLAERFPSVIDSIVDMPQ